MSHPASIGLLTLEQKIEQGFAALIERNAVLPPGYGVYSGINHEQLERPAVIVVCEAADHHETVKSNFVATCRITVETVWADATKFQHQEAVARVRDLVMRDDLIEMLNRATDEATFFGYAGLDFAQRVEENHWVSECAVVDLHVVGNKIR